MYIEEGFKEAIYQGHTRIVEFLAPKSNCNPDLDRDYLLRAVRKGRLEVLKALRNAGLPVKPEYGYNLLINEAITRDYPDVVRFFSDKGIGSQWDGRETSLHYAALFSHNLYLYEMLRTVTLNELQQKDKKRLTPLEAVASAGNIHTFKALLAS